MKKKLNLIIAFILSTLSSFGQWNWATSNGSDGGTGFADYLSGIEKDNSRNIYAIVNLAGLNCYFNTNTFTSSGWNDMFPVKYDTDGNEKWIKQFGGNNNDWMTVKFEAISDVVFDQVSNTILITGEYIYSSNFGCGNLFASGGFNDKEIFLARLDSNGNCIWSKSYGSIADDYGNSIAIDNQKNIFLTGSVGASATFGTCSTSAGGYLAKLDSSGNCIWVKTIVSPSTSFFSGGLKYLDNALYLLGVNNEDTLLLDTLHIQYANSYGKILAQFDLNGNIQWAQEFARPNGAYPSGFKMGNDANNNIYITGAYNSPMGIFGNDTLRTTNSGKEMYLLKVNQTGNIAWVQQTHSTQTAIGTSLSTDAYGNTYLTGAFSDSSTFGTLNPIIATTNQDLFVTRYDSSGNCLGVLNIGEAIGTGVIGDNQDIYIGGSFVNTVNFGSSSVTSHGSRDVFLAKHDEITGEETLSRIGSNSLTIYANPTQGKCNITIPDEFLHEKKLTLQIFDNSGKLIQQKTLEMNEGKIKLNLEAEAKGVYNVTLSNGSKSYGGKIVFE